MSKSYFGKAHTDEEIEKYIKDKEQSEERRYEKLAASFKNAQYICTPDKYQYLHNELTREIAEFLLKPYFDRLKEMGEIDKQ